jgi:hypothetical protein
VKKQQVERRRAAVKAIEENDGIIWYDHQLSTICFDPFVEDLDGPMKQPGEPPGPAWLRAWLGDDFFAHVAGAATGNAQGEDGGLEHLEGLGQPRYLRLRLQRTNLTDAAWERLGSMTRLEYLEICQTRISNAALERLQGLTNLRRLNLVEIQVADEGIEKLQQALPNCTIMRGSYATPAFR